MRALVRHILAACLCLPTAVAPAFAESGTTYGLVIGIDDYAYITDLDGAVNDANDIAKTLGDLGARVTLLLDAEAAREAVLGHWRRIAQKVKPGDRLIVSFAGHGSNEPEFHPGSEADGRDEVFLLAGFRPSGAAAGERIRDDEIAEMIALTPEAQVIFVADACHSGTLSRDLKPSLGFRYVAHDPIKGDPLPPPPPPPDATASNGPAVIALAAVDDASKVPELLIGGEVRGALSFAFADALRGAADIDADGQLTKGEIEGYVRRKVRALSHGAQRPQVEPAGLEDTVLVALPETTRPAQTTTNIQASGTGLQQSFSDLPPVTLSHNGGKAGDVILDDLDAVTLVAEGHPADLSLDIRAGVLVSNVGDTIRHIGAMEPDAFRDAVRKTANRIKFEKALSDVAGRQNLSIDFGGGDGTYWLGETLDITISGRTDAYLALFSIAADGTVSFLYPLRRPDLGIMDPASVDPRHAIRLALEVAPPFGADFIVAVETQAPNARLVKALTAFDGASDVATLWTLLGTATQPRARRLALQPFFTAAVP
ncbi:MAG: caspase family protein [Pseudomonadota bacterium]